MLASALLVIVLGVVVCRVSERLRLPALLGLVLLGLLLGDSALGLLSPAFLGISDDVRTIALILILLRAGLALDYHTLRGEVRPTLLLGVLPFALETATLMLVLHTGLGLPAIEAAMAGLIVAAAAPAVIVPAMLRLQTRGLGRDHYVPSIVITANALENVLALSLFGALVQGVLSAGPQRTPWASLTGVLPGLCAGLTLGLAGGWLMVTLLRSRLLPQPIERLLVMIGGAVALAVGGNAVGIAGYGAVLIYGIVLRARLADEVARLVRPLDAIWYVVQILLFAGIGAQTDLGAIGHIGIAGLGLIAAGLVARAAGSALSLLRAPLRTPERAYCTVALMPKATVQAALCGIPLALGLASGSTTLALAVLAIVVTGPLGALAIELFAPRWLSRERPVEDLASPAYRAGHAALHSN